MSRQDALDGIGEFIQRLRHGVEHSHLSRAEAQRERLDQTSHARVRRLDRKTWTGPLKLGEEAGEIRHVEKELPLAVKNLAPPKFYHRAEEAAMLRQLIGQGGRDRVGQFRRGGIYNGKDRLRALR